MAKEEEPQRSGVRWGGYWPAFVIVASFFAWFALIAFAFRDTQSTFLRAESGWYQLLSHSNAATRASFTRLLFTSSYHGHYTPVAFFVEFKLSEWIGPVGSFWKWRQIFVVSAIATALFLGVSLTARKFGASLRNAAWCAAAITSVLVFQPEMRQLISWPFMVMQLGWILCSLVSLGCLVRMAWRPSRTRWIWLAAASAYAAMHLLGLGIVTVAAAELILVCVFAFVTIGKLPLFEPVRGQLAGAIVALAVAAAVHSTCMFVLLPPEERAPAVTLPAYNGLGVAAALFSAALSPLYAPTPTQTLDPQSLVSCWPVGVLLMSAAGLLLVRSAGEVLRTANARALTVFVLHLFSLAIFFGTVGMMLVRLAHDPAVSSVIGFLIGARYLVPVSFGLGVSAIAFLLRVVRRMRAFGILLCVALTVEPFVAQRVYAGWTFHAVHPRDAISHASTWTAIVRMSRECRAANLPIPNVPLGALTQEFYDWDLQLFEPLLRSELRLAESQPMTFAAWETVRSGAAEYERSVPSLRDVIRRVQRTSDERSQH